VIRVEKIEEEETRPKPRRAPRPRHDAPMTEPLLAGHDTLGKGKKAGKAKTHGRKKDRGADDANAKHHQSTIKRMRSRDLEERRSVRKKLRSLNPFWSKICRRRWHLKSERSLAS
ncbi:MAG: hypothetical protein ACYSOW_08190, partial [Planctomycetota bacterium]